MLQKISGSTLVLMLVLLASCSGNQQAPDIENQNLNQESASLSKEIDTMEKDAESIGKDIDTMEKDIESTEVPSMEKETMKKETGKVMDPNMKKDEAMMKAGVYTAYSPELIGTTPKTVLFFHAAWCPSCRAADTGITSGKIPGDLTILKVDYDESTELKKKYEVLSQHTFVEVDAKGNLIAKWSGGRTVADIVENLQ